MDYENNESVIDEVRSCAATEFDKDAFFDMVLTLGIAWVIGSFGLEHFREAIYIFRQLRSAVPSTGLVQSTRTVRTSLCTGTKCFVTLTFPSLPPLH